MEVVTTRSLIRSVAARWRKQYPECRTLSSGQTSAQIQARLDALDPATATAEEVEAIVGNWTWISVRCDECDRWVGRAVRLGEEPDWESATVHVCQECLAKSVKAIQDAE